MFEYKSLSELTREFDAQKFATPSKVFAALNRAQHEFFQKQMKNPKSAVYEAVQRGRKTHRALETEQAADAFERAVLRKFKKEIGIDIDETWGREQGLISVRKKFKGKFDGVGVFRGLETVWDYKKVNKPKTESQLKNYFKQCAAYSIAHNEMYGTEIQQLAVMTVYGKSSKELGTRVFILSGDELKQTQREFLKDLRQYYKLNEI